MLTSFDCPADISSIVISLVLRFSSGLNPPCECPSKYSDVYSAYWAFSGIISSNITFFAVCSPLFFTFTIYSTIWPSCT